ncbi:MAG: hypothetical protein ACOYOS_16690 [Syntrophales bacterium]
MSKLGDDIDRIIAAYKAKKALQKSGETGNYTTAEILKITGLNRNTFQDWLTRGFITPSIRASTRQGELNVFTKDDLILTLLFKKITMMGFTRPQTARFVAAFKKVSSGIAPEPTWVSFWRVMAGGGETVVCKMSRGFNFLPPENESPDDVYIVNLSKLFREFSI